MTRATSDAELVVVHKKRAAFQLHSLLREIEEKYCKKPGDVPILVTKEFRKYRYLVTVPADVFAVLMAAYRRRTKR